MVVYVNMDEEIKTMLPMKVKSGNLKRCASRRTKDILDKMKSTSNPSFQGGSRSWRDDKIRWVQEHKTIEMSCGRQWEYSSTSYEWSYKSDIWLFLNQTFY